MAVGTLCYLAASPGRVFTKEQIFEVVWSIPRDDYRISSLNCGGEDFAIACMRSNLRYGKY